MRVGAAATAAVLALVATAALPRAARAAATIELANAKAYYAQSQYQKVVDTLAPVMADPRERADLSTDETIDAHRVLGLSYFFLAQSAPDDRRPGLLELASVQFASLLYIDPDYELDAAIDGPDAAAFFTQIKRDNETKLDEIRRQKALDAERKKRPQVERLVLRVQRDPSRWTNFIPFGYPQFRNGHSGKGTIVLVLQSSTFVASAGIYLKHAFKYGWPVGNLPVDPDEVDTIRTEQLIQIGAGLIFFGAYAYSVWDGFRYQGPAVSETETIQPIKYDDTPRALLVPLVTDDVLGMGVLWEL